MPDLDLEAIGIEVAVQGLREWALGFTAALFGDESSKDYDPQDLRRLKPYLRPWRLGRLARFGLQARTLRRFKFRDPETRLRQELSLSIARRLPAGPFRRGWSRIPWVRHGRGRLPPLLWPTLREMAWHDPHLQRRIAAAIHAHFRSHQLVPSGAPPMPAVHPQVWWLLIALVGVPQLRRSRRRGFIHRVGFWVGRGVPGRLRRWWRRRGPRRGLPRRLSELALQQCQASPGWAGFWEQWLIGQAVLRYGELISEAATGARQTLGLLPYLNEPTYRRSLRQLSVPASKAGEEDDSAQGIVDPAWQDQRPAWLGNNHKPA